MTDTFCFHKGDIPVGGPISPTSTGALVKRNPDRAISEEMGIIADLRRAKLAIKKGNISPTMTPSMQQIATSIDK